MRNFKELMPWQKDFQVAITFTEEEKMLIAFSETLLHGKAKG